MPKNPHADFTPALEGYSGQGKFRFWCQMALPLTYDDSLSYYELLCKVVNYLNHTIEDVANAETNVSRLAEAYTQLQNYVNDYFDDLDIEAELRNVLDAMAEDGTLDDLLDPLVQDHLPAIVDEQIDDVVADQIDDAVAGQIDDVVAEQLPPLVEEGIPDEVSDWLTENVDPVGSAVVVDSSLTISGAAADAKVTGDELADLKTQLTFDRLVVLPPYPIQTLINIDTVNSKILFPSTTQFFSPVKGKYELASNTEASFSGISTSAIYVLFNWTTHEISCVAHSTISTYLNGNYSIICALRTSNFRTDLSVPYSIDGVALYLDNKTLLKTEILAPYGNYINVNTTDKKITLPIHTGLISERYGYKDLDSAIEISYSALTSTSALFILYDWINFAFVPIAYNDLYNYRGGRYEYVFSLRTTTGIIDSSVPYTIDGMENTNIPAPMRKTELMGSILSNAVINVDTTNKVIAFPKNLMLYSGKYGKYELANAVTVSYLTSTSAQYVLFDWTNKVFVAVAHNLVNTYKGPAYEYVCAFRSMPAILSIDLPYTVDNGKPIVFISNDDFYGEFLPQKKQKCLFTTFKEFGPNIPSGTIAQDIDIYNEKLFIACNSGSILVYDIATKNLLNTISVQAGHANSIQFSDEFYDENDPFPLLYCGYDNEVKVIRFTSESTATVLKTYTFNSSDVGYHASPCFDKETNTLFMIGYSENSIDNTSGTNKYIVTKWNVNDETEAEPGIYTLSKEDSKYAPYINVLQGKKYIDGKIVNVAGFNTNTSEIMVCDSNFNLIGHSGASISLITELQGIAYRVNGNYTEWYFSNGGAVYKINN